MYEISKFVTDIDTDIFEVVWNNLDERKTYNSAYEIEKATGLVRSA